MKAPDAAKPRCAWSQGSDAYIHYHDIDWGKPVHDDRVLYEFLILGGAQAGLSWSTILSKRAGYAFMQAVGMVNDQLVGCFRYKWLVPAMAGRAARRRA